MTGWTAVFPFDTIKSVVQTGALPGSGPTGGSSPLLRPGGVAPLVVAERLPAKPGRPPSFSASLRAVLTHGGGVRRGLYRGWSAAVMRAFPANAALFWGVHTAEGAFDALLGSS